MQERRNGLGIDTGATQRAWNYSWGRDKIASQGLASHVPLKKSGRRSGGIINIPGDNDQTLHRYPALNSIT